LVHSMEELLVRILQRDTMSSLSTSSSSNSMSERGNEGNTVIKKTISMAEWKGKLEEVKISKQDLNKLVMNYLIIEGYKDAAEKFQQESGTNPGVDLNSISDRMLIRNAIQNGRIEEAIERVNDLNPQILDSNPLIFFHLQQQRLIELIRKNNIQEALTFAQQELAPQGEENSQFLEELERTMALLAFEDQSKSPVASLLDQAQRQRTASELNAAILVSQCQEKDPKLPILLKMLLWSQNQLERKIRFPKIKNLLTAELEDPSANADSMSVISSANDVSSAQTPSTPTTSVSNQ